jgi:two-component system, OmpR family, sensor histidine kinase KdpD
MALTVSAAVSAAVSSAAPHLLAIASPSADLDQFAREALWMAQERDLSLTLAIQRLPPLRAQLAGYSAYDDLATFAERWGITLVHWRSNADLDAIIAGWNTRAPKAVVLGARKSMGFRPGLPGAAATRIEAAARTHNIEVIPDPSQDRATPPVLGLAWRLDEQRPWYHAYILSAFAVSLVAILVKWLDTVVDAQSLSPLFLLAVVYSANAYGMAAASFATLLSVGLFSYFFSEDSYSLSFAPENTALLILFLLVAGVTSNLSNNLRRQASRAQRQAREARALFQLTRDIAIAGDTTSIYEAIVQQCNDIFDCDTVLLAPFTGGRETDTLTSVRARASALQTAYPPQAKLTQDEIEAARWVYTQGLPAGRGFESFAQVPATFQPLITGDGTVAVLALKDVAPHMVSSAGFRRVIGSICRMAALAVEHTLRKQELETARVVSQTEGLRSALLSAISHDFGTPLASIIGSASSLLSYGKTYSAEVTEELLTTIMEEAERLHRFVNNVMQMTRLEAGALVPRMQWADVEDLISTSLDAAQRRLRSHEIYADVADVLPLVQVDFVLMESVLVNVLDNAAKYAPAESAIQITARKLGNDVVIDVADQGRGIAPEDLGAVFDRFYRAKHRDRTVPGTGLGLAICKGIIDAHGGSIEALSAGPGRGTTIRIRLPIRTPDRAALAEV